MTRNDKFLVFFNRKNKLISDICSELKLSQLIIIQKILLSSLLRTYYECEI